MDLERSNAFRKRHKALKKLLLIFNILIYICTTGHFQRMFHLQFTINFYMKYWYILKRHVRLRQTFITYLALNLVWQLNDTITYSVTASQTWQDLFICISLSCLIEEKYWVIKQHYVICFTWSINNLTIPCRFLNIHVHAV